MSPSHLRFAAGLLLLLAPLPVVAAPAASPSPAAPVAAPEIVVGSVLRPSFTLADGTRFEAGTAFPVSFGGETLVLTAHHLFGPNGGLPAQLGPEEVAVKVTGVTLRDAWSKEPIGGAGPAVLVPGAHPMEKDAAGDLALFPVSSGLDRISAGTHPPFHPLSLAAANPKVGDPVWLAAELVGGPGVETRAHVGKVVEVNASWLFYEFTAAQVELRATSGAPILNALGEVVGINLGGGAKDGVSFGAAGPVSAIRANLEAARNK